MTINRVNDSRHWRDRAAEMRALADWMKDVDATAMMLRPRLRQRAAVRAVLVPPPTTCRTFTHPSTQW
jgi:hypothetical protein